MTNLAPGANAPVNQGPLTVTVSYTPVAGADLDVSAFLLGANGKVRGDADMCFYGQTSVGNGAVSLTIAEVGRAAFTLNLDRLDPTVEKVALTATIYENRARFAMCQRLELSITGGLGAQIPTQGMQETALILGEFYRYKGAWKFRCVAQGFNGGLAPLATHFGVDISAPAAGPAPSPAPAPIPAPTPVPAPAAAPSINLTKISLDKSKPSISLEKKGDGNFGEIKVNLNWNQGGSQPSGGFFGKLLGGSDRIDLDVGCLFELQDGHKGVVQALGNAFGNFRDEPYIQLMGDDRTGANADGEWLRINGAQWQQIKRVLVFACIYEGVPNWQATDAVVTLYVPGQPPIEVRVSEEGGRYGCCAIALLENIGGSVKVTREVRFFQDQEKTDQHYRWGLRWRVGSK